MVFLQRVIWAVLLLGVAWSRCAVCEPKAGVHYTLPQILGASGIEKAAAIRRIPLEGGSSKPVITAENTLQGIVFSSTGIMYFGARRDNPLRVEILQRDVNNDISRLGTVVDASEGLTVLSGWSFQLAIDSKDRLYFTHPRVYDEDFNLIRSASVERFDPITREQETVIDDLILPAGVIVDSNDVLYYTNMLLNPLRVDLFRADGQSTKQKLGRIIEISEGNEPQFGWSIQFAFDTAQKALYFTRPPVYSDEDELLTSGSIESFDLTSLTSGTFLTSLELPSGIATNAAGSLFFGNLSEDMSSMTLYEVTPESELVDLGQTFATNGRTIEPLTAVFDLAVLEDSCPEDDAKTVPGVCGCGVRESSRDRDGDGRIDCLDQCPVDPAKTAPGECGCGIPENDQNQNGAPDCQLPDEEDELEAPLVISKKGLAKIFLKPFEGLISYSVVVQKLRKGKPSKVVAERVTNERRVVFGGLRPGRYQVRYIVLGNRGGTVLATEISEWTEFFVQKSRRKKRKDKRRGNYTRRQSKYNKGGI